MISQLERRTHPSPATYRGTVANPRPVMLLEGDYAAVTPDAVIELTWRAKDPRKRPQEMRRLSGVRDFHDLDLEEKCRILDRDITTFERKTPALASDYELVHYTLHNPLEIGWQW